MRSAITVEQNVFSLLEALEYCSSCDNIYTLQRKISKADKNNISITPKIMIIRAKIMIIRADVLPSVCAQSIQVYVARVLDLHHVDLAVRLSLQTSLIPHTKEAVQTAT